MDKAIEINKSKFTLVQRRRAAMALAKRKFPDAPKFIQGDYAAMYLDKCSGVSSRSCFDEKFVVELMCELQAAKSLIRKFNTAYGN